MRLSTAFFPLVPSRMAAVPLSVRRLGAASLVCGLMAASQAQAQAPRHVTTPSEWPRPEGVLPLGQGATAFERQGPGITGVYVPNWKPADRLLSLRPGEATHLLYAFLRVCGEGQRPEDAQRCAGDHQGEIVTDTLDVQFDRHFAELKRRQPGVTVLASVGGWAGSDPFFQLAATPDGRARFARSAQRFLLTHPAFDGIDIDWEHPGSNGSATGVQRGSPQDGAHYLALVQALRAALDEAGRQTGRHYRLSVAINTTRQVVGLVDWRQMTPHLDWVFMMNYDYAGAWDGRTGHHTALASPVPAPGSLPAETSVQAGAATLQSLGVPAAKLVAGVAFYGRGFAQVQPGPDGVPEGAPAQGGWPDADGSPAYASLFRQALSPQGRARDGWQLRWDRQTQAWSLWHPGHKAWVGYDDPRAVHAKAQWARQAGLAGTFAWELTQDNGDLLRAMNLGQGHRPVAPATARPGATPRHQPSR